MSTLITLGIIIFYILSSFYFYYLGGRNEARWWVKKLDTLRRGEENERSIVRK